MPRADAVTTAGGSLLPSPPHASHPPPTPHRAPLHPTRPRPGPWFASGLASDAANPPFADGLVSPPHSPGAPLPPAAERELRSPERRRRRSGICPANPAEGRAGALLLPRLPPPRPSVRSPLPPSFSPFFPGSLFPFPLSLSIRLSIPLLRPPPHPHRSPTVPLPSPLSRTLCPPRSLLICPLLSKRGSAAPGGAQRPDPGAPGAPGVRPAAARAWPAGAERAAAGSAGSAGAPVTAAAAEMSRRKQSKPRQIKRKFARGAGSWEADFWGGGRSGRERERDSRQPAPVAWELSNFARAAGGTPSRSQTDRQTDRRPERWPGNRLRPTAHSRAAQPSRSRVSCLPPTPPRPPCAPAALSSKLTGQPHSWRG